MTSLIGFHNNKFIQIYFATRTYGSLFLSSYKNVITFVTVLRRYKFKGEASTGHMKSLSYVIRTGRMRLLKNDHISE
jgi:hypothetical protein